ncbi:carboxypeptidase-like regulatory domain-containing protein, partial [Flavobacteriaceae bacterium]|nr:carboxypeptidase-like regulatory domain-containing protein [Flavobacteriaceae bacterium]
KQNELKMDIVFKGVAKIKTEVIFLNNIPIKSSDFQAYKESDSDLPFELTKYDPDFWNGYNIIEPSEVLKSFKIEKN